MPAGLQIFDDVYGVQLDDSYINYNLKYSRTITGTNSSLTFVGTNPLLFAVCEDLAGPNCYLINTGRTQSGNTFTFRFNSVGRVTIYVFDISPPSINSNYGFQTFNAAGELRFDSNGYWIRVEKVATKDVTGTNSVVYNRIPNKRIAAMTCSIGKAVYADDTPGGGRYDIYVENQYILGFEGGYADYGRMLVYGSSFATGTSASLATALLIDVTGLPTNYG